MRCIWPWNDFTMKYYFINLFSEGFGHRQQKYFSVQKRHNLDPHTLPKIPIVNHRSVRQLINHWVHSSLPPMGLPHPYVQIQFILQWTRWGFTVESAERLSDLLNKDRMVCGKEHGWLDSNPSSISYNLCNLKQPLSIFHASGNSSEKWEQQ